MERRVKKRTDGMRKVYLTININATDHCFDNLTDFKKMNVGEIVKQKKMILKPFEIEELRARVVAESIIASEDDLLIGAAIRSLEDLKTIVETIGPKKRTISRIYFDNGIRKRSAIEKYKKDYSLHSRWLDYSPEDMEQTYLEFDERINEIKEYAVERNIELVAI